MMNRLQSTDAGFDRQFMRAEVMMHQHVLHELDLWQQVGGSGMSNSNSKSNKNSSTPSSNDP